MNGPRRRPLAFLGLACALAGLAFSAHACVSYRWKAIPITSLDLQRDSLRSRDVRFETDSGPVRLTIDALDFPFVYGKAHDGPGIAAVNTADRVRIRVSELDARGRTISSGVDAKPELLRDPPTGATRTAVFHASSGWVALQNPRFIDSAWVEGRLARSGGGRVRVDLRHVKGLAVREVDGARTVMKTIGLIAATGAAVALVVALTKESCPFVYVDRGEGYELVGEAYAGAAFRSTQRDDLLPLPALGVANQVSVRLRNEARETQYTDFAELVVVDHPRSTRALSTFDGGIVLVGAAEPPVAALDRGGRDAVQRLAGRDELLVETTPPEVSAVTDGPFEDEINAEFRRPAVGTPVLELVGGNTTLLDLVFGRFFAAMGDRLDKYLAQGNDDPTAGPRIKRWREREGVDLIVEMRTATGWTQVAVVPTVGPASLREIAIPLPAEPPTAGERIHVRLRSGLGFWRIDRLALSVRDTTPAAVRHVAPRSATGAAGRDERASLAAIDGGYNALSEMNEAVEMEFDLPAPSRGHSRSAFLHSNGYYNVHPPLQSEWLPGTLKAIRDQKGAMSRLGRDLARVYEQAALPR